MQVYLRAKRIRLSVDIDGTQQLLGVLFSFIYIQT